MSQLTKIGGNVDALPFLSANAESSFKGDVSELPSGEDNLFSENRKLAFQKIIKKTVDESI
jgi:hypothetical protein